MKIYRLTVSSDNGFQTNTDLPPKELLEKDLYAPYPFREIGSLFLELDRGRKKTDLLLAGTISLEGIPMHRRIVEIVREFRLLDIQFVPITGKGLEDYFFAFFNSDLTPRLDFVKSDFHFIQDMLGDIEELAIKVPTNRNGAIKAYSKHIHESIFNKMIPRNGFHFNAGTDIFSYDAFRIGHFDKSFYVSERLKNALESHKITGAEFSEAPLFTAVEPENAPAPKPRWKFW